MAATAKPKQRATTRGRATKRTTTKRGTRKRTPTSAPTSIGTAAAKVLSEAANAVRSLVPQLGSERDTATAFLTQQHREVERSFAAALDTDDLRMRRTAMQDILRQLTLHTMLEETIFYPAVKGIDTEEAKDMVLEAYEEHHVVKLLLKEIPKVDPRADSFEAKMTVLKELVEHHVQEEEHEMFPMAERRLGPERSRALAEAMAGRAERGSSR